MTSRQPSGSGDSSMKIQSKNLQQNTRTEAEKYQFFERFTSKWELAGLLVEKGFLNADLFFDRYGPLQEEWDKCRPIIHGLREKWNEAAPPREF